MRKQQSIRFPFEGMTYKADPLFIPEEGYRLGVNVMVENGALAGRHGVREVELVSDTEGLVEEFEALNFQGACRYSPAQGLSAIQFSDKGEYLFVAAGGRKFTISIRGQGPNICGVLAEVNGLVQPPDLHQMWMTQAENYLISGDDFATTWYWEGEGDAKTSTGYVSTGPVSSDADDPREDSQIPHRMRCPVYYAGYLTVITDSANVFVSDIIHGDGKTNSEQLIRFVDQTYWATGQRFQLPTQAGNIVATYVLPNNSDALNQGGLVLEAEHATYLLDFSVPRSSWPDVQILFPASFTSGCTGQFAFDVYDNDSVRRTRNGIETLSFNKRTGDLINNPVFRLSEPVDDYLAYDHETDLRLASVKFHRKDRRLYSTVRPFLEGYDWQHRGLLCFNYELKIWEGLNTFPCEVAKVRQLLPMSMGGQDRLFVFAGGTKKIALLEVERGLREDVLLSGVKPIQHKVYTRDVFQNLETFIEVEGGTLQFSDIEGEVEYKVYWKSDLFNGEWKLWQEGTIYNPRGSGLSLNRPKTQKVVLNELSGEMIDGVRFKHGRQFSFQVVWTGKASLRSHSFESTLSETQDDTNPSAAYLEIREDPMSCAHNEFEYSQ